MSDVIVPTVTGKANRRQYYYIQNTNLVSYPYYAKFSTEGDSMSFWHINIVDLAESDRGANMIRGTVSLDNEKDDDCTVIMLGMHNHIEELTHMVLKERGLSMESFVHRIQDKMFTSEDEKHFDTQWTLQSCGAGQVQVTWRTRTCEGRTMELISMTLTLASVETSEVYTTILPASASSPPISSWRQIYQWAGRRGEKANLP
jgi:hypothetical protein